MPRRAACGSGSGSAAAAAAACGGSGRRRNNRTDGQPQPRPAGEIPRRGSPDLFLNKTHLYYILGIRGGNSDNRPVGYKAKR
jgi:hypothetical protein